MVYTRRDVLKLGLSGAAICATGQAIPLAWAIDSKKIPIGLQIHSVREEATKNLPAVIAVVAKMGYAGIEFAMADTPGAGYYGYGEKPHELRKLLDDNGLKCCGTHTPLETLQSDKLQATIEFSKILGNKYLIVPELRAKDSRSKEPLDRTVKLFNEVSAKVQEHGMQLGYHAHGVDYKKVGDKTQWEIIFDNTPPEFIMQVDVGNSLNGGGDPYAMLRKYPGRATTIHLKEHGGPVGAPLGEGTVRWNEIFEICETIGKTEWYIVEHGTGANPMETVALCLKNLRKMGK